MNSHPLILASQSSTRALLLQNAGVVVEPVPARVDETSVKQALLGEGHVPADVADALAELKATKISAKHPGRLVLGADQVLECGGQLYDKPTSHEDLRSQLKSLSAKRHQLISAAVVAENGKPVFRARQSVTLHVRPLSDDFIDAYVAEAPAGVMHCVGGYQLEGIGAQLFYRIEGDYFTVLGLPLLDVLGFLRERGFLIP